MTGPTAPSPTPVLVRLAEQPAATLRLVCFPYSGGGRRAFRRWPAELAPDVEVWTAILPGRDVRVREPWPRAWPELVAEFTTAVREQIARPYALFGHSLGALLAFEVARGLTVAGSPPEHLLVSGRGAPDVPMPLRIPPGDTELLIEVERVYRGGIPAQLLAAPELLEQFLPLLRADLEFAENYRHRPEPILSCPITALTGAADTSVRPGELTAWQHRTSAAFERHQSPGGHFYLSEFEHSVLTVIRTTLGLTPTEPLTSQGTAS